MKATTRENWLEITYHHANNCLKYFKKWADSVKAQTDVDNKTKKNIVFSKDDEYVIVLTYCVCLFFCICGASETSSYTLGVHYFLKRFVMRYLDANEDR